MELLTDPKIGLYSLISNDGCACGSFDIQGVSVDISCGRGAEKAIRVFRTNDMSQSNLQEIADEVKRQVDFVYGRDLPIMFEAWEDSREARALEAWRKMPKGTPYGTFLETFEIHGREVNE